MTIARCPMDERGKKLLGVNTSNNGKRRIFGVWEDKVFSKKKSTRLVRDIFGFLFSVYSF